MVKSIITRRPLLFTSIISFVHGFPERHAISCCKPALKTLEEEINDMALNALFTTAFFRREVFFYVAEVAFDMQIKQDGQYRVFPFEAFRSFHSGTPLLSVSLALGFLLYLGVFPLPLYHKFLSRDIFWIWSLKQSFFLSFPFQKILWPSLYSDILFLVSSCSQML